MAKFHKSTAEQLMAASELPTDEACIEAVEALTEALLDTIRSLQTDTAHGSAITQQGLKQHKLPANMDMSARCTASHASHRRSCLSPLPSCVSPPLCPLCAARVSFVVNVAKAEGLFQVE